MKAILASLALSLLSSVSHGQTPGLDWNAQYDNQNLTDVFIDMLQDEVGNTYVCGYSDNFSTGTDIVVAKYSLSGDTLWTYRYNGNGEDRASAIALTNNNDVVITGHSEQSGTAKDIITILINGTTGNIQTGWPQFYNGADNGNDWGNDVAVRQSDNLIAVCGAKTDLTTRHVLVSYETTGSINWDVYQYSNNFDISLNLFCDFYNNGTLVVIDQIQDSAPDDTTSNFYIVDGDNGTFLNGSHGDHLDDVSPYYYRDLIARELTIENNVAYVLTDWHEGNLSYGDFFAVYEIDGGNPGSSAIDPIIVRQYDEPLGRASGLAVNSSRIYVAGYEDVNSLSTVQSDGFVSVFNKVGGTQIWHENYGSSESSAFYDIAIDNLSNANIYVTGFVTESGNKNALKARFAHSGQMNWEMPYYGDAGGEDETYRISLGSGSLSGSIWTCGKTTNNTSTEDGIVLKCCTFQGGAVTANALETTLCLGESTTLSSTGSGSIEWSPGDGLSSTTISNPIATPTASTTYTVTVSDGNGCSASSEITVTVSTAPILVAPTTNDPVSFCDGGSATLSASITDPGCGTATGYQWLLDGDPLIGETDATLIVDESGDYSVIVENSCGCSAESTSLSIVENAIPSGNINSDNGNVICSGNSITLDATLVNSGSGTISGYQWQLGNIDLPGEIGSTLNTSQDGDYTLEVTNSVGCTFTTPAYTVTVSTTPSPPSTPVAGGNTTFCHGGLVELCSQGSGGFQWYNDGSPINQANGSCFSAEETGVYTASVTIDGCESDLSGSLSVTAYPLPEIEIGYNGSLIICDSGSVTLDAIAVGNGPFTYQWSTTETSPSISVSTSGIITITTTDANTCVNTSSEVEVEVNPSPPTPQVNVIGASEVCEGESVQLTSTIVNGNQWFLNGNEITEANQQEYLAIESGNYTSIATVAGCSSTESNSLTVTIIDAPPTPEITLFDCDMAATNIPGVSYQWYLNGNLVGNGTRFHTATSSGFYEVEVTNSSDCESTLEIQVLVEPNGCVIINGINDPQATTQLQVYPNPADGIITLGFSETVQVQFLNLIAADGKVVLNQNSFVGPLDQAVINTENVAPGIYFLNCLVNEAMVSRKILIQH